MKKSSISSPIVIIKNIAWLFGDKISKLLIGIFVYGWIGQYLGPEEFGKINYALALSALFLSFASLGLSAVIIKELVQNPEKIKQVLASAFCLQLISGFFATITLCIIAYFFLGGTLDSRLIIIILSLPVSLKISEVVRLWLEAKLQSRISVLIDNSVFFLLALIKITAINFEFSTVQIAIIFALESASVSILHILYYKKTNESLGWQRADFDTSWRLLRQGAPLIVSSVAFLLYSKIDQIMLEAFIGVSAVGVYSASTRIAEAAFFIPSILVSSIYPSIQQLRKTDSDGYQAALQRLYNMVVLAAVFPALIVSFFSVEIIDIVYGQAYEESANILKIYTWSGVFVALAAASGRYFLSENLQNLTMYRHVFGACLNVLLNLLAIPHYGVIGAACASVISFVVANYLFDAITPKTRFCFKQKTVALLVFPGAISLIKDISSITAKYEKRNK